jgi:division protein 1
MLGTLMGPGFRAGQPGRSGPDDLFPHAPFPPGHFRMRGDGPMPPVFGGRFIYTTGNLRPRDTDGPQEGGPPVDDLATYASLPPSSPSNGRSLYVISITAPPDQLASILGNMFGQMAPPPGDDPREGREGVGAGLQGLLAALLNPRNARHGDAVYSQEALDQIISTLMEQHPTSNAPGPAPPEAIAALPKKLLDEELLGPEGKGECSVCMDDVHIGDEVVMLPCSHWFHEACASAWLGEHNTCPICRKSIGDETPPSSSRRPSNGPSSPTSRNEQRSRRLSLGSRLGRESTSSRNEARLDSIRATGRLTPTEENPEPFRWQPAQMGSEEPDADLEPNLPGSYRSYRRRDSDMSIDNQRDSRRGYTSGSDRSRESLRSSGSTGNSGGPIAWLRDRFSSNSNNRRHD